MTYSSLARSASALIVLATIGACGGGASTATVNPTPATTPTTSANPSSAAPRRNLPSGVTAMMFAQGDSIFHARACARCHGADAKGATNGPNLTTGKFLHVDGSMNDFVRIITSGVPADSIKDKTHTFPMSPRGGPRPAPLTDDQIRSVAAYVYALNHP